MNAGVQSRFVQVLFLELLSWAFMRQGALCLLSCGSYSPEEKHPQAAQSLLASGSGGPWASGSRAQQPAPPLFWLL